LLALAASNVACSSNDATGVAQNAVKPTDAAADSVSEAGDGGETGSGGGTLACNSNTDTTVVNTFIGGSVGLQIDQIAGDANFGNANLVKLADVDNSPSGAINIPLVSGATTPYIDWENLTSTLSNHQLKDIFSGKDPSAFPGNSSCVGAANNPDKDELLYVGAANNNDYLYLNVLRASSLGDMGYTWLFTKEKPACAAQGSCDSWLKFTISENDVLVFGHFRTGDAKLLSVYKHTGAAVTKDATAAIDWSDTSVWTLQTGADAAVAVNTDVTDPGGWGIDGLKTTSTVNGKTAMQDHVFAEGAVATSVFGSGSVCGKSFWTTVISKSSGNTASGADVKDLIGPKKLNFGSITGEATATSNCDLTADLKATAKDGSDNTITASCVWYDVVGTTRTQISTLCDDKGHTFTAGSHTLEVEITDSGNSGCSTTVSNVSVTVLGPIVPTLTAPSPGTASCSSTPAISSDAMTFTASATGGDGSFTYTWTGCTVDTSDSTKCTVDPTDSTFCVSSQEVKVVIDDGSTQCASKQKTGTYNKTTTVTATVP
jgi:hypothetical protein